MPRSRNKAAKGPETEVDEKRTEPLLDADGNVVALPAPVYDERGNVRPRGTAGAVPMTYDERVAIAERLAAGQTITTTAERSVVAQDKINAEQLAVHERLDDDR